MERGSISKIIRDQHFGFIHLDNSDPGTQDVFFHGSQCENFGELREGDLVQFEIETSIKGPKAKNLKLVKAGE